MLLELQQVELQFGGPPLLVDANLRIERGSRLCLLGRNGCGKSSLLAVMAGSLVPDDGRRRVFEGLRIGFLPQETRARGDADVTGRALDIAAAGGSPDEAEKLLDRLAIAADDDFAALSGGQRRRVLLARALAGQPDLLLLDEPTNHLDPDIIEWLEQWLAKPGLSVVFVSHDRRFMENVASEVIEIDRGQLHHGRMGYRRYLVQRQQRLDAEAGEQARFEKKLSEEEAWIRTGIQARRTRNEGRVRQLQAMRERQRNYRRPERSARAEMRDAEASGRRVLELSDVAFQHGDKVILDGVNLSVMRGDRIGIIGANGSGKTTLVKLMLGQLVPSRGTVRVGTRLAVAEFDQHREALDETRNVADNVDDGREFITTAGGDRHVIGYLKDFLFTPEQARAPITRLSGGERARLMLARLFARPFNLLVMDEPTNDLDVETLELLEEMLGSYDGTLLLVSHDRAFLDNVTTAIVHLDGNGGAEEFSGGYSEYRRVMASRAEAAAPAVAATRNPARAAASAPRKMSYKHKRELEQLPRTIEQLEEKIDALHARMSQADFYTADGAVIAEANTALSDAEAELAACYARWEALEAMSS